MTAADHNKLKPLLFSPVKNLHIAVSPLATHANTKGIKSVLRSISAQYLAFKERRPYYIRYRLP